MGAAGPDSVVHPFPYGHHRPQETGLSHPPAFFCLESLFLFAPPLFSVALTLYFSLPPSPLTSPYILISLDSLRTTGSSES